MLDKQKIESQIEELNEIPEDKNYWMLRTQGGMYYDEFLDNKIIALEHTYATPSFLYELFVRYPKNNKRIIGTIKQRIQKTLSKSLNNADPSTIARKSGLIASQIFKFAFSLKNGDCIVIPSESSNQVSFGIVQSDELCELSPKQQSRVSFEYPLIKKVKWIKTIHRSDLDPYLYKMFSSHQAIIDVKQYAEVIERSVEDFFVLNEEAHFIINVQTKNDIHAADVFGLGSELLSIIDELEKELSIGISSKDLIISTALNSPGKINLKSKIKRTTFVAGIVLACFGGGFESKKHQMTLRTDGIPGLLDAISRFMEERQKRSERTKFLNTYLDSLDIKNPDDFIKVMKQFSDNKDLPK